jgi:hypothetical protein
MQKESFIRHLFFALFIASAVLGCESQPPPQPEPEATALTPADVERLKRMPDFDITKYQFVLSCEIKLTRILPTSNDRRLPGGGVVFENVRERSHITFPNKAPGVNSQGCGTGACGSEGIPCKKCNCLTLSC